MVKRVFIMVVMLAVAHCSAGAAARFPCDPPDSTLMQEMISDVEAYAKDTVDSIEAKNRKFYENLAARAQEKKFAKWLHSMLIVTPRATSSDDIVDETELYVPYEGKQIIDIEIESKPIFDRARSKLQKAMESVHTQTWRYTIRRDLLFKPGEELDPDVIVRTKQLLRSRDYLYDAQIIVVPDPQDSTSVSVKVITRDKWTIGMDGSISGFKNGYMSADVYDYNFIGSGNKLRYRISMNWKDDFYRGSLLQYNMPNIMKSFFEGEFVAGRANNRVRYLGYLNKRFMVPTDYSLGARGGWERSSMANLGEMPHSNMDFTLWEADIWAGKSFQIEPDGSSIYAMARYDYMDYYNIKYSDPKYNDPASPEYKPSLGPGLNPQFHSRQTVFGSLGFYKENFLATNLIYGYGFKEYISTGFKVELNGGYSWEEYGNGWFAGVSARAGGFTGIGYLLGDISAGGFIDFDGHKFYRSAINFDLFYFTNLININPHNQFRQFFRLNATMGFNRAEGVGEYLRFNQRVGPRYYYSVGDIPGGRNRLIMSTESVLFTPWIPVGFRMAIFAYGDVGWIGNHRNFFKNKPYSIVGFGVRLKNERLVFSTIEISFNFAFSRDGLKWRSPVWVGSERRMPVYRFAPDKPQIVEYR